MFHKQGTRQPESWTTSLVCNQAVIRGSTVQIQVIGSRACDFKLWPKILDSTPKFVGLEINQWCCWKTVSMCCTVLSLIQLYATQPARLLCQWNSPSKNTGVGLPFPSPRDLSDLGIEPKSLASPALAGGIFTTAPPGKSMCGPGNPFPIYWFTLWTCAGPNDKQGAQAAEHNPKEVWVPSMSLEHTFRDTNVVL